MAIERHNPEAGARNLLQQCLNVKPGESLIILNEDPAEDFYDAEAPAVVRRVAEGMGLKVTARQVPFASDASKIDDETWDAVCANDHAIFFARLGDQFRLLRKQAQRTKAVIVYALDVDMLGSAYGQASNKGFVALKRLVDQALGEANHVRVTCPLGTDISGVFEANRPSATGIDPSQSERASVSTGFRIQEFPVPVAKALDARPFAGTVALAHCLAGTGNRYYTPFGTHISGILHARLEDGRMYGLEGPQDDVRRVSDYIESVGRTFDFDPWLAQTWHAGLHPGCDYRRDAIENLERWTTGPFANPRAFHFHMGGEEPPGEINWHIIDHTLEVDGIKLWEEGRLFPERIPSGAELLDQYSDIQAVFENPRREIGL